MQFIFNKVENPLEEAEMKLREFESMSKKHLTPELPGFVAKGKLVFETPIGMILRGFCYEPSAWDENVFRIEVLLHPLYIPYEHVVFLISHDLGSISEKNQSQKWWNINSGMESVMTDVRKRIQTAGMKWLGQYESPCDVALKGEREGSEDDPHLLRAIAYSWIMCGNQHEAIKAITILQDKLNKAATTTPWMNEMIQETVAVNTVLYQDIEKAKEMLMMMRNDTIAQLGLKKLSL